MKRSLQERSKKLKAANLRLLVQVERYLTLSSLPSDAQEDCLEEVCDSLEKAERAGASYRSFTGSNLKKYCDRLMAARRPVCDFESFGRLLLQIQLLALITGLAVAVLESFAWTHTPFYVQKISVWLVYGMAILERMTDWGIRTFAGRNLFRGYPFFYEKRYILEWCMLIAAYVVWSALTYITPAYQQVTGLWDMLCLLGVTGCFYGLCVLADTRIPLWLENYREKADVMLKGNDTVNAIGTVTAVVFSFGLLWLCYKYLIEGAGWGSSLAVFVQMIVTALAIWIGRWGK